MSAAVFLSDRREPASILDLPLELFRREPLFAAAAFVLALSMIPTAFALVIDPRQFNGVPIWEKPLKFELALTVYLATLAWFAGWLPDGVTHRRWYRAFAIFVVACVVLEMAWIGGAAAMGIASHFNTSGLMATIYPLMGVIAVILTSATLVYGVLIARDTRSTLSPAFRLSVTSGLVLTFVLTVIAAGAMAGGTSHWVGGNASDAEATALMGWARDGGDLRVAHFFATHAMHAIPAFGLVSTAAFGGSLRWPVAAFAAAFTAFVLWTLVEAMSGRPFLPGLI